MTTRVADFVDLGHGVRAEFALMGFYLVGFLGRARRNADGTEPDRPDEAPGSTLGGLFLALPNTYLLAIVAAALYLPRVLALQSVEVPGWDEWPALIDRGLKSNFAALLQNGSDGKSLVVWPLLVLLAPWRALGPMFLGVLGAGLAVQFSSLLSGEVRPASILVAPSPLDWMALGALLSAIWQGVGRSGDRPLARWALLMGLALAAASIGFRSQQGSTTWGPLPLLAAPQGFGAVNFILKIMATTLLASLAWREPNP